MSGVNKVIIIGNLCAKPEVKFLPSGQAVCDMRIATNEKWKDKDGNTQEKAEFHSIVVWGKMGENCGKYLDKGRQVFVEGRLTTRDWVDKTSGDKRYRTEVVATNVQFLGSKDGRRDDGPPHDESDAPPPRGSSGADDSGPPPDDSEIPF